MRCQASYDNKNNVDIACSRQGGDSENIASIHYRVNGGSLRTGEFSLPLIAECVSARNEGSVLMMYVRTYVRVSHDQECC